LIVCDDSAKEGGGLQVAITKDMSIGQVVQQHPQTIPVFLKHGLMCIG